MEPAAASFRSRRRRRNLSLQAAKTWTMSFFGESVEVLAAVLEKIMKCMLLMLGVFRILRARRRSGRGPR